MSPKENFGFEINLQLVVSTVHPGVGVFCDWSDKMEYENLSLNAIFYLRGEIKRGERLESSFKGT